ncbi:hypothetical protein PR048_003288 [Dryococelus australis]|uniref:Uncharacterized protein n=1 Tax=Dryococelus australis TaxID=614101 RepID=A0ABQ9IMK9_9NEOP|nr:hypothetical protein PR048_003288 [Dryococelus australis]
MNPRNFPVSSNDVIETIIPPDFRVWESCRTMRLVGGFSQGYPASPRLCIPALLHTHPASLSSALKTSMLKAAQISSLTHSLQGGRGWVCAGKIPVVQVPEIHPPLTANPVAPTQAHLLTKSRPSQTVSGCGSVCPEPRRPVQARGHRVAVLLKRSRASIGVIERARSCRGVDKNRSEVVWRYLIGCARLWERALRLIRYCILRMFPYWLASRSPVADPRAALQNVAGQQRKSWWRVQMESAIQAAVLPLYSSVLCALAWELCLEVVV